MCSDYRGVVGIIPCDDKEAGRTNGPITLTGAKASRDHMEGGLAICVHSCHSRRRAQDRNQSRQ